MTTSPTQRQPPNTETGVTTQSTLTNNSKLQPPVAHISVDHTVVDSANRKLSNTNGRSDSLTGRASTHSNGSLGSDIREQRSVLVSLCHSVCRFFSWIASFLCCSRNRHDSTVETDGDAVTTHTVALSESKSSEHRPQGPSRALQSQGSTQQIGSQISSAINSKHVSIDQLDEHLSPDPDFANIISKVTHTPFNVENKITDPKVADYITQQDNLDPLITKERKAYFKSETQLLGAVKRGLNNCYDGKLLNKDKFQAWYANFTTTVDALVEGTIKAHRAHVASGLAISAATDQQISDQELQDFANKTRALGETAKSLKKGIVRFKNADKLNLIDKDGKPVFDAPGWEETNVLNQLGKPTYKDAVLTRDLKTAEGDVIAGIGGLKVDARLDGKPANMLDLLRAARDQFANELLLGDESQSEIVEVQNKLNDATGETARQLQARLDQLKAAILRAETLQGLPDALVAKYEQLKNNQQDRGEFHDNKFAALEQYVLSVKDQNLTNEDKMKKLPLTFIYDICSACNVGHIIHDGCTDSPDFIRIQESDHFLPRELYLKLALPYSGANYQFVQDDKNSGKLDDNLIVYNASKFTLIDDGALKNHAHAQAAMQKLRNESGPETQVALFLPVNQQLTYRNPEFQLQMNMHLPSGNRKQNPDAVRNNLALAKEAKKVFKQNNSQCDFTVNIGGDVNVTTSQLTKYNKSLPDGFSPLMGDFTKQRSNHPQFNIQYNKCKPQYGGVHTAYNSDRDAQTMRLLGSAAEVQRKGPIMTCKTALDDGKLVQVIDTKASHLIDHEMLKTTSNTRAGKSVTTLDLNALASCTERFQHDLPENSANHGEKMAINGVIKFKLLQKIWADALETYNAAAVAV